MIVAGFGFTSRATVASLRSAFEAAGGGADVDLIAAPAEKAAAKALRAFAEEQSCPVRPIDPESLRAVETATHSDRIERLHGTGSVAEAGALSAAGAHARLLTTRQISSDRQATCALAIGGLT